MTVKRWFFAAVSLLFVAGLAIDPAAAQTSIKVVVNSKPITSYDISQRAGLLRLTTGRGGAAAKRAAMEELIDEQLKTQEATRAGIRVSKAEVDEAFNSLAGRVKLSPKQLGQALRQAGVRPETLRDRLEAEIGWGQILRARFRQEVRIAESDVLAALRRKDDEETDKSMEYRLQSVIFVIPAKSSSSMKNQRRRDAERFRAAFNSCDQSEALAQQYSEVVVRPAKLRLETELPADLRELVEKTPAGKTTKPQNTENGLEIFAVCEKREIDSNAAARMEVEEDLRAKEGQQLSRRYLRELRSRAIIDYR
ncbi:peptidylprolyl isomerase [Stappia sp. ES.058]|uniref:peptidylprolyl isomerase n=1 Tax=Stappia sp. ES.058 TaxID=1881061 RepID=UPI000879C266|nr:peptidylprolyl isomerase [Stappia sp. ES.058]SDU16666.1 periplasmic chaperone for outer membrane proteins SurA [Stappia sp. ES.058]